MDNKNKIEKVRILEKGFPANIPEDMGHKPLEVVNEAGETIALFFDTAFMKKKKYKEPLEFIRDYDGIIDSWDIFIELFSTNWGELMSVPEHEKRELEVKKHPTIDYNYFCETEDKVNSNVFMMIFLGRLTYPYLFLEEEKCRDALFYSLYFFRGDWAEDIEWVTNGEFDGDFTFMGYGDLLFAYDDIKLIGKLFNFLGNDCTIIENIRHTCSKKLFLDFIFTDVYYRPGGELGTRDNYAEIIHQHPEILFTKETIEFSIEYANTSKDTELLAFLLDYKNKHFPVDGSSSFELAI